MWHRINSAFVFRVGRATAQADNLRNWVKCQVGTYENCGEQSDKMMGISPYTSVSHFSVIPPMPHTQWYMLFIYQPRCIIFSSQHFSFPCQ